MPTNSSGWARFRSQAETELAQLRQLLTAHAPLVAKCRQTPPDFIECSALATMLHSFYTGIENILSRVTREIDNDPVKGERWHRDLLQRMTEARAERPAVLSDSMRTRLQDYLGFRHFFRSAYSIHFHWQEMETLVLDSERTFQRFSGEIAEFLAKEPPAESPPVAG